MSLLLGGLCLAQLELVAQVVDNLDVAATASRVDILAYEAGNLVDERLGHGLPGAGRRRCGLAVGLACCGLALAFGLMLLQLAARGRR